MFCVRVGLVLWTEMMKKVCVWDQKEFSNVHLLMTAFDCPEVTLCSGQDVKIQVLADKHAYLSTPFGSKP